MLTTTGGTATLIRNHFQDILNEYLENTLLAADLLDAEVFPANRGTSIEFHRLAPFRKDPRGLSQTSEATLGIPGLGELFATYGYGAGTQLKGTTYVVDRVIAQLRCIGNDLPLSELEIMAAEPNPVPALSKAFLYQASDTLDVAYINMMVSNTTTGATQGSTVPACNINGSSVSVSVVWGDGSATLTEATLDADIPSHRIAAETFNTVEAVIRAQSGKPRRSGLFEALIAPQLAGDLRVDGTFQDIALKGNQRGEDKFERASIGNVFGVRVLSSENVATFSPAGTIDATNDLIIRCPVVGADYAKRISHAKGIGKPSVRFLPPTHEKADLYGLWGALVWKVYFAAVVTQPLAGAIIKAATSRARSTAQPDHVSLSTTA